MTRTGNPENATPEPQAPPQLSIRARMGFGVGDYACNLYWQSVSFFLLFYYTDAVGLSAAQAGLIYLIASIFDGATDPLAGAVADRTRTRWGRYRGYVLFGGIPLALAFVLMYYRPPLLEGLALFAWLLGTHLIFRLTYTAVSIPYTSLSACITNDSNERASLAGYRIVFATLAAFTVVFFTQPIVAAFSTEDHPAYGFTVAAAVFAVLATLIYPLVFVSTTEHHEPEASDHAGLSFAEYRRSLFSNGAFWSAVLAICAAVICTTALSKSVLYYFKYYLNDEANSRYALICMAALGLVVVPAWTMLTRLTAKRTVWGIATIWSLTALVLFAFVDIRSTPYMIAWYLFAHVGSLGFSYTFWAVLPDTIEYGEWRSGIRAESFVFGLGQFFLKVALGIGAGLFGWLLDLVGYVPNEAQSETTLAGLKWIMVALPGAGVLLAAVAMSRFPMGRGDHGRIVQELRLRRESRER